MIRRSTIGDLTAQACRPGTLVNMPLGAPAGAIRAARAACHTTACKRQSGAWKLGSCHGYTLTRSSSSTPLSCSHKAQLQPSAAAHAAAGTNQAVTASSDTLHWYENSSMFYSNYPLDRAPALRKDPTLVKQLQQLPTARTMLVSGRKVLVQPVGSSIPGASPEQLSPVWFESAGSYPADAADPSVDPIFLGLDPETSAPCFAILVKPAAEAELNGQGCYTWAVARNAGPSMAAADAALAAVATGLAQWNLDAKFHGSSGAQTLSTDAGFSRTCPDTNRTVYPRIDPAIITLVTAGSDWCLLGRKKGWPPGRYSTLAGFLEVGETLEQALAREVLEEARVAVDINSVRYHASQPWPFPRSLMVGFYATLQQQRPTAAAGGGNMATATNSSSSSSGALQPNSGSYVPGGAAATASVTAEQAAFQQLSQLGRVALREQGIKAEEWVPLLLPQLPTPVPQPDEMSDVRWFHRDWLSWAVSNPAQAPGSFAIPGPYSLAHHLIQNWLEQGPAAAAATAAEHGSAASSSSGGDGSGLTAGVARPFGTATSGCVGDSIPQVKLDPGVQKYVLLRLSDQRSGDSKLMVWGAVAAAYHNHILQEAKVLVNNLQLSRHLTVDVLGGGRIEHYPEQQVLSVYGYSAAFGPAPHEVAAAILRKWYPFYAPEGITVSYEGY